MLADRYPRSGFIAAEDIVEAFKRLVLAAALRIELPRTMRVHGAVDAPTVYTQCLEVCVSRFGMTGADHAARAIVDGIDDSIVLARFRSMYPDAVKAAEERAEKFRDDRAQPFRLRTLTADMTPRQIEALLAEKG